MFNSEQIFILYFKLNSTIRSEIYNSRNQSKYNKYEKWSQLGSVLSFLIFSCSFAPLESPNHGRSLVSLCSVESAEVLLETSSF